MAGWHTVPMRRVLVVGMSGAGKTTAARRVGARLGLPFHEMDALALGPNWSQPPGLVDEVKRLAAEPSWIFDSWGYPAVRDIMWQSADTILWLDYPATVVLPRLIRRSVVRTATNAELFGGNRETLREWLNMQGYESVHFSLKGNAVMLWGTVPNEFERRWVRTQATMLTGATSVVDHMVIRPDPDAFSEP